MALELLVSNLRELTVTGVQDESQFQPLVEMTDNVREGCNVSLGILNQLLTFEKLSAGMMQLELKLQPVMQVLAGNLKLFKMQARQKGVHMSVEFLNNEESFFDECLLHVDEHKLNQVIRNLLSNAVKFTPPKGSVVVQFRWNKTEQTDPMAVDVEAGLQTSGGACCVEASNVCDDVLTVSSTWMGRACSCCKKVGSTLSTKLGNHGKLNHQTLQDAVPFGVLLVSVVDSGPGVDPADQNKLFQEYVQINPGELQKGQGSGLGLSISKSIVELHNGKIGMRSAGRGKGSTFFVMLPTYMRTRDISPLSSNKERKLFLRRSSSRVHPYEIERPVKQKDLQSMTPAVEEYAVDASMKESRSRSSKVRLVNVSSKTFRKRSMVVDDSASNRKLLRRLLEKENHDVLEADDGVSAVSLMKQVMFDNQMNIESESAITEGADSSLPKRSEVDLVFIDFFMPQMNGPRAVQILRQMGFRGIIVGITGMTDDESQEFIECGADVVLFKPITIDAIWKALRNFEGVSQSVTLHH
jgi:osomolarity two-component system, sensor histidine kinase SLN1